MCTRNDKKTPIGSHVAFPLLQTAWLGWFAVSLVVFIFKINIGVGWCSRSQSSHFNAQFLQFIAISPLAIFPLWPSMLLFWLQFRCSCSSLCVLLDLSGRIIATVSTLDAKGPVTIASAFTTPKKECVNQPKYYQISISSKAFPHAPVESQAPILDSTWHKIDAKNIISRIPKDNHCQKHHPDRWSSHWLSHQLQRPPIGSPPAEIAKRQEQFNNVQQRRSNQQSTTNQSKQREAIQQKRSLNQHGDTWAKMVAIKNQSA